jgi:hypothetical protein
MPSATKTLFEKRVLDSQKLYKKPAYPSGCAGHFFLKFLKRGAGEKLFSKSFSPALFTQYP